MTPTETLMTAEELLALPDDGKRRELVDGRLRVMDPSGSEHGFVAARLAQIAGAFVTDSDLGFVFGAETGFRIRSDPDTVRAPDLAFVRRDRVPDTGIPKTYWPGAPDLAVEVVSPGDSYQEVTQKVAAWLAAGTRVVWVVNPARRDVAIHRPDADVRLLAAGDRLPGDDVLPGFECRVAELFPPAR